MTKKSNETENNLLETRGRKPVGERRTLRVSNADWQAWQAAAEKDGLTVSEWIRSLCAKELHRR